MIIGLTGYKLSGKDTVGAYLVKQHDFTRISFADNLKRAAAALLDIPYHEIDNFKNDETVFVAAGYKNRPDKLMELAQEHSFVPNQMWSPIRELTFRTFLQRFGTEMGRDVFGRDFWVDQALPVDGFYAGRKIVVTDVRFINEAERIRDLDGKVIRIHRQPANKDLHSSEMSIDDIIPDYAIINNNTIEHLYDEIEHLLAVM